MKILVTGSSGMIGTNLGLRLIDSGIQVHGLDRRANGWTDQIPTTQIDLAASDALTGFHWPADLIVHLAAHAKVHASVENPRLAFENIAMAATVLEYARLTRTPVLLGSSREVYGNVHRTTTGERSVFVDESASPYSASKLAVEALGHSYRRCYRLPVVALRFSNVYGRYDCDLERIERVVALFIRRIALSAPVTVFGREKLLDFTYVDDCISGIMGAIHALHKGRLDGCAVNVASGTGSSLGRLAECIGRILGVVPSITYREARPGEITRYVAKLDVARRRIGYSPRVLLEEGVRRAIEWQESQGVVSRHGG